MQKEELMQMLTDWGLEELAEKLRYCNIEIVEDSNVQGCFIGGNDRWEPSTIIINGEQPQQMKRVTLLHELAHLFDYYESCGEIDPGFRVTQNLSDNFEATMNALLFNYPCIEVQDITNSYNLISEIMSHAEKYLERPEVLSEIYGHNADWYEFYSDLLSAAAEADWLDPSELYAEYRDHGFHSDYHIVSKILQLPPYPDMLDTYDIFTRYVQLLDIGGINRDNEN